jgi:uncharacterized membrane protein YfcA
MGYPASSRTGGELLIPTIVLLFGIDIKLAGSLSLAVSLPTMIVGFSRYSRDAGFAVLRRSRAFVLSMGLGSIVGAFFGGYFWGALMLSCFIHYSHSSCCYLP